MCGVIGILGSYPLRMSRELLLLLAHRGQDAAGLLWIEGDRAIDGKSIGSPSLIRLPDTSSNQILGSTRYPTSGKRVASEEDLNTFVGPFKVNAITLTHNGNITNMASVSEKQFDCDGEFLAERLSFHLENNSGDLPEAFRKLEAEVDGSYSLAGFYNGLLFAYRDSHGFKPLVFGRSSERTIVASESTVLDMGGVPLERDVYPGELLVFGNGGKMESYSISQNANHSHCFFEYVYFAHPAATIENQLVYDVRFRLGRALAQTFKKLHLDKPDYVVPVPDTSRPAAQAMAETLDVPIREIILKNRYLGRTFIVRTQEERDAMARSKYIYLDGKIRGKNILVVDDSIVRGTTAKMIVADLRKRGAAKVYFAVTCPPQAHPCYYGIDISTDRELIASTSSVNSIAEYIETDALIYQEEHTLENSIGIKDLCLACLDGDYPTEHARSIRKGIQQQGSKPNERDYERDFSQ
ncbi:MAG: amidophosphoribosyltransferase [Candidatus Thorarchaeota archaeon]|nr:amidophosphoribosyltransferase [Candidatus Thorarchaeota archaeon]